MDEQAWAMYGLDRGVCLVAHGPFTACASMPQQGTAFYCNSFGLTDPSPWRIPASWEIIQVQDWHEPELPHIDWEAPDSAAFAHVFQEISHAVRRGVFEKTVPVSVQRGKMTHGSVEHLAYAFARVGSPKIPYAWIDGESGFAGATPELLFTLEGRNLHTMALAGTARAEEKEILAVDEKEIREHEYVAQTLIAKLADLGTLQRHERGILDLGPIVHFQTLIDLILEEDVTIEVLLRKLHPTPALGPLPRTRETLDLLLAWRSFLGCPDEFGAPFGLLHDGKFQCVVAIRGLWWQGAEIQLPAGCGVIEASRMVNEWRELRLKRDAVKSAIGLL